MAYMMMRTFTRGHFPATPGAVSFTLVAHGQIMGEVQLLIGKHNVSNALAASAAALALGVTPERREQD